MLLQLSSLTTVVLSSIVLVGYLAPVTEAHSWLECVNWQFKNPDKEDWTEKGGECQGYARRFPLGHKFGSMDSSPARHYQQDNKNPDSAPPCSDGKHGKERGMLETLAEPREDAYDQKGWGKMTVTRVGDDLCLRWPAKTHGNEDSKVQVYKNCSGNGGKDTTPCGGCFKVPMRATGGYVLQWRWEQDIMISAFRTSK